jgi:hypothetical protein
MEFIYLPIFNETKNMSLEEFEENIDPKTKRYILMKSIMDLGMGLIYIGVGFMILFAKKIGLNNDFVESTPGKIFAGLLMLYGLWRIYRGIKKNYLRER